MESFNKDLLEQKVRKVIDEVTCSKYIGPLDVQYEEGLYVVKLGLNCRDASPISLGFTGDEAGLLEFVKREFKKRKLQNVQFVKEKLENGKDGAHYPIIEI